MTAASAAYGSPSSTTPPSRAQPSGTCSCASHPAAAATGESAAHANRGRPSTSYSTTSQFADGDTFEREIALAILNGNQRKIRGATTDVDHQDQIAGGNDFAPVWILVKPGVKGSLRLFEQRHLAKARLRGGFQRKFASELIKRRGHSDKNILRL